MNRVQFSVSSFDAWFDNMSACEKKERDDCGTKSVANPLITYYWRQYIVLISPPSMSERFHINMSRAIFSVLCFTNLMRISESL